MSDFSNRIVKNTGWLYAKMGITMFISLYATRLILNALGAEDFGIYNVVGGAIAMLGFLNASLASATQRFMSYAEGEGDYEKKKSIFNVSVLLHIVVAGIVFLLLFLAGVIFFHGVLNIPQNRILASYFVYASLVFSTVFTVTTVPYEALLNSHQNMRYYSIVGILEAFLKLAIAFVCVYTTSDKLIVYAILMAAVPLITLSVMRVYCHRNYEECVLSLNRYFSRVLAKEMASFAGWSFLNSMASMFTMQGMSILLNMFGGVIVNAAHAVANQLAGQLMVFSNNMLKALNPVLVISKGAGRNDQMLEVASTGNKLSFLIYTFFAIPFVIETPYILDFWLKDTPEWAILFVRLVLIRQMISQLTVTLDTCVNATGNIRKMTMISTFIWISPLIIGYFLYKEEFPIYTIYVLLIIMVIFRGLNSLYFCHVQCGLGIRDYLKDTFIPCIVQTLLLFVCLLTIYFSFEMSFMRLLYVMAVSMLLHPVLRRASGEPSSATAARARYSCQAQR